MASGLESEFATLHEIVKAAKIRLSPNIWDYLIGGTETETTLRRNRMALDSIAFKPRVLRNVSTIDPSSEILGKKIRLPVMLAPVGSLESFEPGGGITVAKGAGAGNVAMLISSVTTLKLEDIVKGGGGPKIYQLYVRGDDKWVADRVKQAMDAGYDAFCITVDTQVYSRRERDIAKRFVKSWRTAATGQDHQAAFSWENFKRVKDKFPDVKFMLKGIGTGEDAEIACQHGVWGVYCSNHGGRQLDHGRGSAAVLPEVIDAVKGTRQDRGRRLVQPRQRHRQGDLPGRRLGRHGPALLLRPGRRRRRRHRARDRASRGGDEGGDGPFGRHQPEAARQELHRRRHADQPARRAQRVPAAQPGRPGY